MTLAHMALRARRTPLAPATLGICATLAVASAFSLPRLGPGWFLGGGYGWVAAFAVWGWGGVALLAGRPDRSLAGVVATLALFVALCAPLCVPLFWAEELGVSGARGATSLAVMGVTLVPAVGAVLVHAPLPKRTFDDGVMWLIVQIGALWAIVAW